VAFAYHGQNRAIRPGEVALVVEVSVTMLDDDLGDKKQRYEAIGVSEYWVVDVEHRLLHRFVLEGGQFQAAPPLSFGALWPSLTIAGLSIASADLTPAWPHGRLRDHRRNPFRPSQSITSRVASASLFAWPK
jgi:Uma2 family endonuclease